MQSYWQVYNGDTTQIIYQGDALEVLRGMSPESVHCCITSPPYWGLRDYGVEGQIGLEPTLQEYVEALVEVFREVRRVLRDDGTLWLNLGDGYNGSGGAGGDYNPGGLKEGQPKYPGRKVPGLKPKDLIGIPWMVAFALRADGWYLRSDCIWHKPNPMPESVKDRCTKAHEYIFLLSKRKRYFYDAEAVREPGAIPAGTKAAKGSAERFNTPGVNSRPPEYKIYNGTRNRRSVWTISTQPYPEAHFATFPPKLIEPCILAGTSPRACEICGAPWERVVERIAGVSKECPKTQAAHEARGGTGKPSGTVGKSGGGRIDSISRTIGWRPTCSCSDNDGSGRCVVLDPFVGSGTTLLVAQRLGRSGIGIELNPDYCAMASRRIDRERWSGPRCDDADK